MIPDFTFRKNPYGRGGWIRTNGPLLPKQVRYQTAPRPDALPMQSMCSVLKYTEEAPKPQAPINVALKTACLLTLPYVRNLLQRVKRLWRRNRK